MGTKSPKKQTIIVVKGAITLKRLEYAIKHAFYTIDIGETVERRFMTMVESLEMKPRENVLFLGLSTALWARPNYLT
jgi:hypothetical protein